MTLVLNSISLILKLFPENIYFSSIFKIFIYLFTYLAASVLVAACKIFTAEHRLSLGLSCSEVYGISVPQPGMEPASPALQSIFLTTGPPGKSL